MTSNNPTGGASAWSNATIDNGNGLTTLSCPSATLCIAADSFGRIVTSTNPTAGAGAWSSPVQIDAASYLSGISCPSASLCVAVEPSGNVLTSTNPTGGASAWSSPVQISTGLLIGVTCPSATLCVAWSEEGDVVTSANPTGGASAWSDTRFAGQTSLVGVSCPSLSLCVGTFGHAVLTSTNPTGGASTWSTATVDSTNFMELLSCPSVSLCVAFDSSGNVFTSTNPTGGASAWSEANVDGTAEFGGVSCPSTSLCVAGDSFGQILTSTNPAGGASAWSVVPIEPGHLGVSNAALNFGSRAVGSPSGFATVNVFNTGSIPLHVGAVSLTGANSAGFSITSNTCNGASIGGTTTCAISVRFTPLALGPASATLDIPSDDPAGALTVALSGSGVPDLVFSPTALMFPSRTIGSASPPLTVSVTNNGPIAHIGAVSVTGTGASDFSISSDSCGGTALAAFATCAVSVKFTPQQVGSAQAKLNIPSGDPNNPSTVDLSGTGVASGVPVPSLMWTDRAPPSGSTGSIGRAAIDGSNVTQALIDTNGGSVAQDAQHIYWVDGSSIARANLDGSGVNTSFISGVSPAYIAVDPQHIYWTTGSLTIARANLDGSGINNSLISVPGSGGQNQVLSGLAVEGGNVYWSFNASSVSFSAPGAASCTLRVGRANVDGSGINPSLLAPQLPCSFTIFPCNFGPSFNSVASSLGGLAVDRQYIFWGESTSTKNAPCPFPPTTQTSAAIGRANIDGSGENDNLISLGSNTTGALAVDSQHVYWTTTGVTGGIGRSNLDGTGVNTSFISDPNVSGAGLSVSPAGAAATYTAPVDGASGVPADASVFTVFSEGMDKPSTAGAFSVVDDTTGQVVTGSVSWFGNLVPVFTPSAGYLKPGDRFTATISTAAKAADGTPLASPISWSFTVSPNPVVTATSPAAGATEVFPNAPVVTYFSQPMNQQATQAAFSLKDASGNPVSGSFAWFGPTALIFTPSKDLAPGSTYTASVSTAAQDQSGNPLGKAKSWSFTTTTQPVIDALYPAAGTTGVFPITPVVVVFSRAMDEQATAAAFSLAQSSSGQRVRGTVVWFAPRVAVFFPFGPLQADTGYTASVGPRALGANGQPLADPTTWSFTTGSLPSGSAPASAGRLSALSLAAPPQNGKQAGTAPTTRRTRDRSGRPLPPALRLPHIRIPHRVNPSVIRLAHRLRLADLSRG